jgi:hypothetical protein
MFLPFNIRLKEKFMKIKLLLIILLVFEVSSHAFAQAPSSAGNPSVSTAKKVVPDHAPLIAAVDKDKDGCMSEKEWKDAGLPDSAWKVISPNAKNGCVNEQVMLDTGGPDGIDLKDVCADERRPGCCSCSRWYKIKQCDSCIDCSLPLGINYKSGPGEVSLWMKNAIKIFSILF